MALTDTQLRNAKPLDKDYSVTDGLDYQKRTQEVKPNFKN